MAGNKTAIFWRVFVLSRRLVDSDDSSGTTRNSASLVSPSGGMTVLRVGSRQMLGIKLPAIACPRWVINRNCQDSEISTNIQVRSGYGSVTTGS